MRLTIKDFFARPFIFVIVVLNFMIPACFYKATPPAISSLLYAWDKVVGVPVIMLCMIGAYYYKNNKHGDVVAYYAYRIISTIIITFFISGMITGTGALGHLRSLAAICYIGFALQFNYKSTVKWMSYLLSILVVINFITILLYPHGMYYDGNWENYFLGYDNGHIVVFMPALFFTFEYAFLKRKYLPMIATWGASFASAFIVKSGVTIGGMAIFTILLILVRFPAIRKFLFNWKTVLVVIILVFILIVILRKQMDYRDLIMQYFGKDPTLTERTVLWDRAFGYIKENPLFGIGDNTEANVELFLLRSQKLAYAHNEILDVLVRSGVVGLLLYFNCIVQTFLIIRRRKDEHIKNWLVFMTAYWIMMMFESYSNYSFYYLYFVMLILPRYENAIVSQPSIKKKWVIKRKSNGLSKKPFIKYRRL